MEDRDLLDDSFRNRGWGLGIETGFLQSNGPQEGGSWDLSKARDVKELFEMIAFEQPVVVTRSPPCTAFSQFQNWSWYPEWEKWQATNRYIVEWTSTKSRFVQDATSCMSISWQHHHGGTLA